MIRRPPRSTPKPSSAASDVYKRQKEQKTVNAEGKEVLMKAKGRHDPCVLPRAVPMVDAMVALVLADHLLLNHAQCDLINK